MDKNKTGGWRKSQRGSLCKFFWWRILLLQCPKEYTFSLWLGYTGPDTMHSKEIFLKCYTGLKTWQEGSNQCELIEMSSTIIEIGAILSEGQQIDSEEVKYLREKFKRLTSWYPVHLQTIEALIWTSWSRCYLYQINWLAFSFSLVPSSPIGSGK